MNKISCVIFLCLFFIGTALQAQVKKLLTEINSISTKEVVELKYNAANQLIYFSEKGAVTYREFTLKYDKVNDQLIECLINQDKGEIIQNITYIYGNADYVTEEIKSSGKQFRVKATEYNKIYIDDKGRLTKTAFDDGKVWEEFTYDNNNNLVKYLVHSAMGDSDLESEYEFDTNKCIFSDIQNLPLWFWALQMNNMKWCSEFIGVNNAIANTSVDPRFGTESIEITYDYDADGCPLKQYYDGELVKEFKYKEIK